MPAHSSPAARAKAWCDKTETGRIAWLIAEAVEPQTPLMRKIAQFSRLLLWVILGLAAVTFVIGVARGQRVVDTFMAAVALAVGAIPEGLPAALTIVLAIGVARMAKRRASPRQPLLTHPLIMRTGLVTLIILLGGLGLFLWELHVENSGLNTARTVVINLFVLGEAFYLFNCRSLTRSFFTVGFFSNRLALLGAAAMIGLQLLFTYAPWMNRLFHSAPIGAES